MKVNKKKIELILARKEMTVSDVLKENIITKGTYFNILKGLGARPSSVGKLAKALGVDVTMLCFVLLCNIRTFYNSSLGIWKNCRIMSHKFH